MATSIIGTQQRAYGIGQGLQPIPPFTIVAQRAPTTSDRANIGTFWIYTVSNDCYVLTSINNGISNWVSFNQGGTGQFSSLVITTGPNTIAGLTTFNGNVVFNGNITQAAGVTSLLQTLITGSLSQDGGATLLNTDAIAQTINIGTGAADKTVTLGSTNTTSTTTINSGSGNINLNGTTVISKAGTVLQTNCTAGGATSIQNIQLSDDNSGVLYSTLKRYTTGTITAGDRLYLHLIQGQEGGADRLAAAIDSFSQTVGAGIVSADIGFSTTNTAGAVARRLSISSQGQVNIETAGQTLAVNGGGLTPFIGNDQLAAGTKAVANADIQLNYRVFITVVTPTNAGLLSVVVNAGVGFTVTSANAADTSTFNYFVVRQI